MAIHISFTDSLDIVIDPVIEMLSTTARNIRVPPDELPFGVHLHMEAHVLHFNRMLSIEA